MVGPHPDSHSFPVPVFARQVPPGRPVAGPLEHPVEHHPVISPPTTPTRSLIRQQRLKPRLLLLLLLLLIISQIMTIKHQKDLPHPPTEIHRTGSANNPSNPPAHAARSSSITTRSRSLAAPEPRAPPGSSRQPPVATRRHRDCRRHRTARRPAHAQAVRDIGDPPHPAGPSPHRETRTPGLLQVLCHGEITPPRTGTQRRYRVTQATSRD